MTDFPERPVAADPLTPEERRQIQDHWMAVAQIAKAAGSAAPLNGQSFVAIHLEIRRYEATVLHLEERLRRTTED